MPTATCSRHPTLIIGPAAKVIMRGVDRTRAPCQVRAMNVTVRIPDELAERLTAGGADLERRAPEAFALAAFQAGDLTHFELRVLPGFETRFELDDFLKARGIDEPVTPEDVQRDLADLKAFGA